MKSIIRKISSYNFSSRNGNGIKYIVMHFTGNTDDTALNNANYFGGGNRDASAHYFVDDDNIVQVVEDGNASWNCGDGNGSYGITNQNSIGIEMCGTGGGISANTENNTIDLVKYLMGKYNVTIDRVVRHYDASRKICPSPWSGNNWTKWYEFKSKLDGSEIKVSAPVAPIVEENIDVYYQVYANGRWLPEVKNLTDYAGIYGASILGVKIRLSSGDVDYRVATTQRSYYPWVRNHQDYAGDLRVPVDMLQIKQGNIKYRVHIKGKPAHDWLPWVIGSSDFAGIGGIIMDAIEIQVI